MKINSLFVAGFLVFFSSCKDKNHYVVETTYRSFTVNGDSTLRTTNNTINAATDSAAYFKGMEAFEKDKAQSDTSKGVAVRFLVRNGKGNVVLTPGSHEAQQIEETIYPNQKPKEGGN